MGKLPKNNFKIKLHEQQPNKLPINSKICVLSQSRKSEKGRIKKGNLVSRLLLLLLVIV